MSAHRPDPTDPSHSLPHPRSPIDAMVDPFVGNVTADDNLFECVQVALWKALGDFHRGLGPEVRDGVVTLTGTLPSEAHRERALAAVQSLRGVRSVIVDVDVSRPGHVDTIEHTPAAHRLSVGHAVAEPLVYVTRYCSLDEASVSAAIRQAIAELTQFLSLAGKPAPEHLYLVYRNRQHNSLTVEIGVPVDAETASRAAGELHVAETPSGSYLERPVVAGMDALLASAEELEHIARGSGVQTRPFFWQIFAPATFTPWRGHPAATLRQPVETGPAGEHRGSEH